MDRIKIGDRLIVANRDEKVVVEKIYYDEKIAGVVLILDWGVYGKSRVYAHDEGKTWHKYNDIN